MSALAAFNTIGWAPQNLLFNTLDALFGMTELATEQPARVEAYLLDTQVDAAGGLTVVADSSAQIFAQVTNDATSLDTLRNGLQGRRGGRPETPGTPPGGESGRGPRQGPGSGRFGGGFGGGGGGSANPRSWQDITEGKAPLFVTAANAAAVVHLLKVLDGYKDVKLFKRCAASVKSSRDLGGGSSDELVEPRSRNSVSLPGAASTCCTFFAPASCSATVGHLIAFDRSINRRTLHAAGVG